MYSTFPDQKTAERAITATLRAHRENVLAFERRQIDFIGPLRLSFPDSVGTALTRDHQLLEPLGCTVILRRDEVAGYVYTAYPESHTAAPADFPGLDVYFGGYLHQDWRDEFESPAAALETLLPLLGASDVERMLNEMAELLGRSDSDLHRVMRELSLYLAAPQHLGISERQWLQQIRKRAAAELAARTTSEG